jgi:hypothetical protein
MTAIRWAAAFSLAAALLWWFWPPASIETARMPRAQGAAAPGSSPVLGSPGALPGRDLFRYADVAPPGTLVSVPESGPSAVPVATPSQALRLVGFVSQASGLHAALALEGRVVLASAGDTIDGYAILAIDAERGVSVRAPDGTQRLLEAR